MHPAGKPGEVAPTAVAPDREDRDQEDRDRHDANRAVAVSAIGLGLTGLIELAIALLSGSVGLLSDAFHNLSDVSTSIVVFIGLRLSKRRPTDSHPYGWGRAEDVAGLGVALVIWISAAFAVVVSLRKLFEHGSTGAVGYAIAAAGVGIVGNQVVARYKLKIGRRINSAALVADAQHSWLDAISSAGALLGLVGVALGLRWADAVAGLLVAGFVCHVGWEVTSDLVNRLIDGVDPAVLTDSLESAEGVAGVQHAHVRARWMGRALTVEVEGYVAPHLSIDEVEVIGSQVSAAVQSHLPEVRSVLWVPRPLSAHA